MATVGRTRSLLAASHARRTQRSSRPRMRQTTNPTAFAAPERIYAVGTEQPESRRAKSANLIDRLDCNGLDLPFRAVRKWKWWIPFSLTRSPNWAQRQAPE